MRTLIIFIITILSLNISAQKLSVESFSLAETDLSAQTSPRKDNNDVNCALVKVQFVGDIDDVEGNVVKPFVKKYNETWVYMTQRSRQMQIKTKDYPTLSVSFQNYGIDNLESNRTYILSLRKIGDTKQMSDMSSVSITCPTHDVLLYVDKKFIGMSPWNGKIKEGRHVIEAKKDKYCTLQREIQVVLHEDQNINLAELTLKKGSLFVNYKPFGADVYIDSVKEGHSPHVFTGIDLGYHNVEIKKDNYVTDIRPVTIEENKTDSITGKIYPDACAKPTPSTIIKKIYSVNGVPFRMIKVDGGTFMMGATDEEGDEVVGREKPAHQVTLSTFYIGEFEVTQKLWTAVMGNNPSSFKGANMPVENVSWDDCQKFISKLNILTKKHFRLPTEAEWEYACRGGKKSEGFKYSGGNVIEKVAWCYYSQHKYCSKTHPVGQKLPNELGIYDMSGNVSEWCQDTWQSYSSSPVTNPLVYWNIYQGEEKFSGGAPVVGNRVHRGGCWNHYATECRSAYRDNLYQGYNINFVGLRLALSGQ